MPLAPIKASLEAAGKHNCAQGTFNANDAAQAKTVVEMHGMFRPAALTFYEDVL